jgi:hypothetical protein
MHIEKINGFQDWEDQSVWLLIPRRWGIFRAKQELLCTTLVRVKSIKKKKEKEKEKVM